jgi:DinB family protein
VTERQSDSEIRKLVDALEAQRREAMTLLGRLTDADLGVSYADDPGEEGPFTVRRLIHRITTHHQDHLQHILKARRAIGSPRSEVVRALAEMQASRAELVTSLLALSDADLECDCSDGQELGNLQPRSAASPRYTIRRIVEHVVEMEEMRLGHIRQALARARSGAPADG